MSSLNAVSICLRYRRAKAFRASPYSVIALHPLQFGPGKCFSRKITLTLFCKNNFITKHQAKKLITLRYLAVSKSRGRIFVEELCPELIKEYLQIKKLAKK